MLAVNRLQLLPRHQVRNRFATNTLLPRQPHLEEIEREVDMVEVFRPKEELYDIAEQAIKIGAKVLWGQIGVYDDRAARLAEEAGLKVVMNRCPKIELFRPFWKPRLDLKI